MTPSRPRDTPGEPPPRLVQRLQDLRAKAATQGLEPAEEGEYQAVARVLAAYAVAAPEAAARVAYERAQAAQLREFEATATEVWERMEYLQGLRKDPPVPRRQVFRRRVTRPAK